MTRNLIRNNPYSLKVQKVLSTPRCEVPNPLILLGFLLSTPSLPPLYENGEIRGEISGGLLPFIR